MENKTPRIHQLKGKSKLNLHPTTLAHQNSKELFEVPQNIPQIRYQTSKPILIRYIDPRLVPIFKELNSLTTKCQEIAEQVRQLPQVTQQEKIEQLLKSTKKINDQFHEIIDNSEEISTKPFKVECHSVTLEGTQGEVQKACMEKEDIQNEKQEQCLDPIEIVNRTSQRLEQLELQNESLKKQLEKQKKRTTNVENENQELREKLIRLEKQKKDMVIGIRHELERLKDDNSIIKLTKIGQSNFQ